MAEIIEQREYIEEAPTHIHYWDWADHPGSGYGFDCDENGVVDESKIDNPLARESYRKIVENTGELVDKGFTTYPHNYWKSAVLKCDCGRELSLDDCMTNECTCGAFYNGSGQRLSDPSNWGEETGESFDSHGRYIGGDEDDW